MRAPTRYAQSEPFVRGVLVEVPTWVRRVRLRAHDSVHGHGGAELELAR